MKSDGALDSGRRCLTAAALAATALIMSARAYAQTIDAPAASAAWKTAALASTPALPVTSSDAKASPAASASASQVTRPAEAANAPSKLPADATSHDDASIAEAPIPVPSPGAAPVNASNLVPTPPGADNVPGLSEIPPVSGSVPVEPPATASTDPQPPSEPNDVTTYEQEQNGMPPERLQSLRDYDSGEDLSTPIGMELREDHRTLSSGEEADGLLIVAIKKGSPAADAGLHAYSSGKHDMITGVAIAGAMLFPPAILLLPALDYSAVGQSYDLIIGVDGTRVRNFLDFQDRTRNLEPGEMIYLSVVRDGKRLQVVISIPPGPPNLTQATN